MGKVSKWFGKLCQKVIDKATGNGLMQEENVAVGERACKTLQRRPRGG